MKSLNDELQAVARECIESRVKQWAEYYFEKQLLPALVAEVRKRVNVTMIERLEDHGVSVTVRLDPKL